MRHDGTWQSDTECLAVVDRGAAQSSASSCRGKRGAHTYVSVSAGDVTDCSLNASYVAARLTSVASAGSVMSGDAAMFSAAAAASSSP